MAIVYGLVKTSEQHLGEAAVRYVGATNKPLLVRQRAHVDVAFRLHRSRKDRWIVECNNSGDEVIAVVLREAEPEQALDIEREYIERLKDTNDLLNTRKGGEPFLRSGVVLDEAQRAAYSIGQYKRFSRPEEREVVSQRFLGKPKSEEHRKKLSEALRVVQAQKPKVSCPVCGLTTNPATLGWHRKKRGH